MKALGKGFSASPFNTFTIRLRDAAKRGINLSGDVDSEVCQRLINTNLLQHIPWVTESVLYRVRG